MSIHALRPILGLALAAALLASPAGAQTTRVSHGSSLFGDLKYGPDFKHFDYVNPNAPKGGEIVLSAIGSFDSLNPFLLKGRAAAGVSQLFETLMTSSQDEASSEYGLIAESVEVPEDFSWVAYTLRKEARWHDGTPVTADDVVFSFETLKTKGNPFYRQYWHDVDKAEKLGDHKVKFHFSGGLNRELPQIIGQLPVLSKSYYSRVTFDQTTLEPPMGSGAYKVASVDPGRSITIERVKDYWGEKLPVNLGTNNFDRMRWDYYRDATVALEAFKAHQYDFRQENAARIWATEYDFPAMRRGLVKKEEIKHEMPSGMQAFAFNIRREQFKDARVRAALIDAFDFEWSNTNLFYGQYARTQSFFANSELAATGLPSPAELKYLDKLKGKVPEEVFTKAYAAPKSDGSGRDRRLLRNAADLLKTAGWEVKNGALTSKAGKPMTIEFLLADPAFERIVQPYIQNLERLGIKANIRTIDTAQYQNRLDEFDYDVIVTTFAQSLSPGNEQRDFWGSKVADVQGSRNLVGIKDPAVDALIDDIIAAPDRESLVAASRALDRVLLWSHYVVPQWHSQTFRVAYWDKFGRPEKTPKYGFALDSWWVDPQKADGLKGREAAPAQ